MFRHTIISLAYAFCVASSALAQANDEALANLNRQLDRTMFRYRATDDAGLTEQELAQISTRLFAEGNRILDRVPCLEQPQLALYRSGVDPSALMTIDRGQSTLAFHRGYQDFDGEMTTPNLPSREVAPMHAQTILERLQMTPGTPGEMQLTHVGGVDMGIHREDGSTELFRKIVTVRFGRELHGLKVQGPGSRIVVHMGENGQLVGLVHRWREVTPTPVSTSERFTLDEVRTLTAALLLHGAGQASGGEIESANVVLFDDGLGVIEPAVHMVLNLAFATKRIADDGSEQNETLRNPQDLYVPLLRDSTARFPLRDDLELTTSPASDGR